MFNSAMHPRTDQDQLCPRAVKPDSWALQFSLLCEISHHISGTKTQINKKICFILEEHAIVRVLLDSQVSETCSLIWEKCLKS